MNNRAAVYCIPAMLFLLLISPCQAQPGWFWQNPLPQGNDVSAVACLDTDVYVAVGDHGSILHTTDGGRQWTTRSSGTHSALNAVSFLDTNTGTAVGSLGTILRTTTGGVTWVGDEKPSTTLLHLGQNYPNPVSASTTIPFSLTKSEHVQLSVYDMLGREVAVLVDGIRDAGQHAAHWNAAQLPHGMYVCVLRAGAISETRRMLLTK